MDDDFSSMPEPLVPADCDMRGTPMPASLIRDLALGASIDPDWAIQFLIESGIPVGGLN